jgi:hypothetical protein
MVMESLNEDMVDVLELREKQLTEMIKMLQKKRRDVRAAVTRLKAETLQPVPVAEENSGGNTPIYCERCGRKWADCVCQ